MVEAEALRKRKQAALRIAAWAARILRRRAARRKLENDSANTIARAFRTYKLQRTYFLRRRQRALSLQRNADLARMRAYEEFKSRRRAAALQILFWYQEIKCRALLKKLDSVNHMIRSRPDRDANARRIQHFWTVARERLRFLELHKTQVEKRQRTIQQERIRRAAVKIQGQFRCYQRRNELAMRRDALHADRTLAAIVIQKHVRRWLAKNTFWQEKISKLSMFRELQRLRQKERVRISGAPIAAPKHAW
ncbi:IQ calmodulin-binding protein, putative [Bodo saltans]|uniref:IQ calmodulin-binding protein, putative n=1 Tax=Bodo saltans TaxID=75058 RepID=A0A0S4JRG4_BODSA|nr:IQ calmodulin-binding protein, putative [Bodo saltans]|eukprot:CUG91664.1 IQ calmodulin-binding protein, putative [Bodo saltans]